MNTITILDRVGREINQSVWDNTKTITRDDILSAINDCNDEMSDLNLSFNEAGPTTYTWAAADLEVDIVSDVGITDYDRVKRLELDNVKAFPVTFNELDAKVRGSFDSAQDLSLQPHPPVFTEWGGKFYRWPYSAARTMKLWYYKQLATLEAGVDKSAYTALTNTYTVPTSISEAATALQTFIPTKTNQGGIVIYIDTDGGEPLTVTVHNSSNVSQGSKTIHQPGTGRIMFPIPWTWVSGTYHFHVTTAAGTTYLKSGTASDLEAGYFESWYGDTPVIPTRYHMLYVNYATATALRKLGELNKAEVYDDGKPIENGGRSKYWIMKYRMCQKLSTKLTSDRPRFIEDLLDSDYENDEF